MNEILKTRQSRLCFFFSCHLLWNRIICKELVFREPFMALSVDETEIENTR